jgi:hypothetical protein
MADSLRAADCGTRRASALAQEGWKGAGGVGVLQYCHTKRALSILYCNASANLRLLRCGSRGSRGSRAFVGIGCVAT